MRQPGQDRGKDDVEHRLARNGSEDAAHDGRVLRRCQRLEQDVKGQEQEPEADRDPAEIARAGLAAAFEGDDAERQEDRGCQGDVEGEHLDDEGGADVRPQHDGEGWYQRHEPARREGGGHQGRRGAALQHGGHGDAGEEGAEAIAECCAQEASQVGAEGAHDAAVDHVQAPQQERHPSHQVKEDHVSHGTPPPGRRPSAAARSHASAPHRRPQAAPWTNLCRTGALSIEAIARSSPHQRTLTFLIWVQLKSSSRFSSWPMPLCCQPP